jgi:DNA excision repair protein ERCC-4
VTNYHIDVVADHRESASGVIDFLRFLPGVAIEISTLPTGDYLVANQVLFERKRAIDFAASLVDGRLFVQATRLVNQPFRAAYVIEGTATDWLTLGIRREALQGALITLSLIFDLPVFRSYAPEETAQLLLYAGRQFTRIHFAEPPAYRLQKAKRLRTRQLRVLQALPGVGQDRARRLLDHFGSLRACLAASLEDLTKVSGIGEKTAEAICQVLGE